MSKQEQTLISAEQETAIVETKEVLASKQDVLLKIGQAQAFNFAAKLLTVSELKLVADIKESKAYKGLTYTGADEKLLTVSNWGECCKHILASSQQHIDERLNNLQLFGEEFFEASQNMGLGYRDLRKLRQLPEADRTLVIESEAIDSGDKEAVKDLIEDLTSKHAKEKDELKTQLADSEQLAEVRSGMLQDINTRLNNTTEELLQLQEQRSKGPQPEDWAKQVHELNSLSTTLAAQAIELTDKLDEVSELINTADIAAEYSEKALEHMAVVQLHCVDQLFLAVNALSMETRNRFEYYVTRSRPMYSEEEILALEQEAEARG
ncbi:hypothetical protein G3R49_12565 [Shewanella sp. WXL01]|uniref:hypothetical protein n=1 Tax=Shewanella sp. WXL01 TaxID=2709721 RepID=UPI0014383928|nr:hypothetical protein [Shewanella sp. WXL01]NKF51391.1 hypothetical protein [Shewanella sp. WXL01]